MTDQYIPVDCGQHSEYELAIMHQQWLQLQWYSNEGEALQARVKPLDLFTRNHEEFLCVITDTSQEYDIRLDKIRRFALDC